MAFVYDPLGLISPFVLQGKHILQTLCREKADWDSSLDQRAYQLWNYWLHTLEELQQIYIPRCYKPRNCEEIVKAEIHNFSDPSTTGYGQCSYLRLTDKSGKIHLTLLMSKPRVAHLQATSIPRLELQAACT